MNSFKVIDGGAQEYEWEAQLRYDPPTAIGKKPKIKHCLANAVTIVSNHPDWVDAIAFDEFAQRAVITRTCPAGEPGEWTDLHDIILREWLQTSKWDLHVSAPDAAAAVKRVAGLHAFHPVRDYLDSLKWDGKPRIDFWLENYMGVETNTGNTAYVRAVGSRWMMAAVQRILSPGSKADSMLVLEGPQGLKKSSALEVLGGQWFSAEMPEIGSKDSQIAMQGVWIMELEELDAVSKAEATKVKRFLSKKVERYRAPWDRHAADRKRQSMLVGTTNEDTYLHDATGNRRWWPVRCTKVDLDSLKKWRDQFWAEAVERVKAGEKTYLHEPELVAAAQREQEARFATDAWETAIVRYLADKTEVTIDEILQDLVHPAVRYTDNNGKTSIRDKGIGKWTQHDKNRIAKILKRYKWDKARPRAGGGERLYAYRRIGT